MSLAKKQNLRAPGAGILPTFGHFIVLACAAAITVMIVGCSSPSPAVFPTSAPPPLDPGSADYSTNLLQEGDVVSIMFESTTNLNTVQKITLDGLLNLEAVGTVQAAGKTPLELQKDLVKIYKPKIEDDEVVTVKLIGAVTSIYVSGAVSRPGKVAMERPLTAFEAVMEAGGFDPSRAKLSDVSVVRIENGKVRVYHLDLKKLLEGREETPFYLKPFDTVHVPMKTFNY